MSWSVSTRTPYVVEVCEDTFTPLNHLLDLVGEGLADDDIPSQEQECMVVARLNLLRLQVRSIKGVIPRIGVRITFLGVIMVSGTHYNEV